MELVSHSRYTIARPRQDNPRALMNSTLHYLCIAGYFFNNGSLTLTCGGADDEDADWIGMYPTCPSKKQIHQFVQYSRTVILFGP